MFVTISQQAVTLSRVLQHGWAVFSAGLGPCLGQSTGVARGFWRLVACALEKCWLGSGGKYEMLFHHVKQNQGRAKWCWEQGLR